MSSKAGYNKRYQDFYLQRVVNVYYACYVVSTIQNMLNVLTHLIPLKILSTVIIPVSWI